MSDRFLSFVNLNLLTNMIAGVGTAAAVGVMMSVLVAGPKQTIPVKYDQFESAVVTVLKSGTRPDVEILQLLYEAAADDKADPLEIKSSMRRALLKLHFNIASQKIAEIDTEKAKEWATLILGNIKEYDAVSPFEGLHPVERQIFQDIDLLNSDPKVAEKIRQLASVETARFQELESAKSEARWSLIFGVASVVGAIVSVLVSVMISARSTRKQG